MSVLIKGMEMPNACDECWALDKGGDYPRCRITGETRGYYFNTRKTIMEECPLIGLSDYGVLIHADELISKLHNTAFKDGDDREICYSVIRQIKPINNADIKENIALKQKLDEALKAVEHSSKLLEDAERIHELCRKDGEIAGLKYAIRFLIERE